MGEYDHLKEKIRDVPDFPKKGILFHDITTLLKDAGAFKFVIDAFVDKFKDKKIDKVVGIESRGFILGGAIAYHLGCGFVPLRKPGKLPAETEKIEYELEYGKDTIEIHKDAIEKGERCLIVDDLIATGGTIKAAVDLVEKLGGEVLAVGAIIDMPELGGSKKIEKYNIFKMVDYEGD